jgi:hypothetical protein
MTTTPTAWSGEVVFDSNALAFGTRVTALSDGTFVLAWETDDDIFAKHLDALGSFTAGDFLRNVTADSHVLGTPLVTQQTDGSVAINYQLYNGAGTVADPINRDIYHAEPSDDFDSTTQPFGVEKGSEDFILEDSVAHGETGAEDPAGGALAIKHTNSLDVTNLELRFTSLDGQFVGNAITIDPSSTRVEDDAALASLHTGFVAVAYDSFKPPAEPSDPDDRDVRMKVFSPDGSQVSGDIILSDNDKFASFPDVTELKHGDFVATWQQVGGIAFKRFFGNGTPLDENPIFIPDSAGGLTPKITPLNDGGFVIAYSKAVGQETDGSGNFDIFLQRYNEDGTAVGPPAHIDKPGDQVFGLNIATLADGRVVVTYVGETGDSTNVTTLDYQIFDPRENTIDGTLGNDNIVGRLDASTINGHQGDDKLTGMNAADRLSGGTGKDVLIGQGGNDVMSGNAGNDRLHGGAGADHLQGNLGKDIVAGGGDADVFIFKSVAESTAIGSGRDTILDFSHFDHDKIDLHAIDANSTSTGNQKFDLIDGSHFHHHAGELRVTHANGNTFVSGDVNGDGKADFSVEVHGNVDLKVGDFAL